MNKFYICLPFVYANYENNNDISEFDERDVVFINALGENQRCKIDMRMYKCKIDIFMYTFGVYPHMYNFDLSVYVYFDIGENSNRPRPNLPPRKPVTKTTIPTTTSTRTPEPLPSICGDGPVDTVTITADGTTYFFKGRWHFKINK